MTPKDTKKAVENIPNKKIKEVETLKNLITSKKTILIASIKNIPASQFQEIGKKLRGKAMIKIPKKNLIFRAIDSSGNEAIKQLKEQIGDSIAILFSDLDSFDLASELIKNKSPAKAKAGQEAPEDIEIQEGPTDLVPGPAISELGALGIQIQIEKGKINIKESKVIVKKGQKISQAAADIMNKLDIKPFSIGFTPLCSFDTKENKVYLEIAVDAKATLKELRTAFGKALALSVKIGYSNKDTIIFLIGKAASHEKALENLVGEKVNDNQNSEDNVSKRECGGEEDGQIKEENTQSDKPEGETKKDRPSEADLGDK